MPIRGITLISGSYRARSLRLASMRIAQRNILRLDNDAAFGIANISTILSFDSTSELHWSSTVTRDHC